MKPEGILCLSQPFVSIVRVFNKKEPGKAGLSSEWMISLACDGVVMISSTMMLFCQPLACHGG